MPRMSFNLDVSLESGCVSTNQEQMELTSGPLWAYFQLDARSEVKRRSRLGHPHQDASNLSFLWTFTLRSLKLHGLVHRIYLSLSKPVKPLPFQRILIIFTWSNAMPPQILSDYVKIQLFNDFQGILGNDRVDCKLIPRPEIPFPESCFPQDWTAAQLDVMSS